MKIICGLGNPGRTYARHRHNIGFLVVDELEDRHSISVVKRAFGAKVGRGKIKNSSVILAKPQTYMNLSGSAVAPLLGYYHCLFTDLIVIHDDIDLELGRMKIVAGSGHGGHNGVKSIMDEIDSPDFYRVRVGVGRPPEGVDPAAYVLQPFPKEEKKHLDEVVRHAADAVEDLLGKGLLFVQQKYHCSKEGGPR